MNYKELVKPIIALEKGYVNHPSDRGGPTKDGITEAVARAAGYKGPMQDMPDDLIESIYINRYIQQPRFDKIYEVSARIGEELVDTGVNMGPGTACTFLQRALNLLNRKGTVYSDLRVDGVLGPVSLQALRSYLAYRKDGEAVMIKVLDAMQGARYIEIAEKNPTQEDFIYGWFANRIGNTKE